MLRFTALALLAFVPAAALAAPSSADLDALDRLAEAFAGAPIGEPGGPATPIDRRLRLAACKGDPEIDWHGDRRDAMVIQCPDPRGWKLFVPIRGGATAGSSAVAERQEPVIRRGDPVTVRAESPGFSISQDGVAMGDAAPGERFRVRIEGAKTPVQAVAVEPGRATLPGW